MAISVSHTYVSAISDGGDTTLVQPSDWNAAHTLAGFGTGVAAALAINVGSAGAPVLFNGALGTPSSGTLTNATGLPVSTGISGLGTGVADFLATPSSANLATAVTGETGSGALVFGTAPTLASTVTIGTAGGTTGAALFKGTTSGTVTLSVADAAGTHTIKLPTADGSDGHFLKTDGAGQWSFAAVSASPGGADTQVQFNDGGSFGGDSGFVFNKTTNLVTLTGTDGASSLSIASGSQTGASSPALSITQTWNAAGTTFDAILLNVTNTASAAASRLINLQVGGSSLFQVRKDGRVIITGTSQSEVYSSSNRIDIGNSDSNNLVLYEGQFIWHNRNVTMTSNRALAWTDSTTGPIASTQDLFVFRDAANILAQRNTTSAQTFRLYDTFTSSTDYHRVAILTARATLSSVSGATVTATSLIPDGAVVVGVTTKVTTGLGATGGTTGYQVGDGSDPDRWGEATTITSGTVTDNTNWTATTIQAFTSANNVVITAVGGNFDGTGVIYVSVQYLIGQAD